MNINCVGRLHKVLSKKYISISAQICNSHHLLSFRANTTQFQTKLLHYFFLSNHKSNPHSFNFRLLKIVVPCDFWVSCDLFFLAIVFCHPFGGRDAIKNERFTMRSGTGDWDILTGASSNTTSPSQLPLSQSLCLDHDMLESTPESMSDFCHAHSTYE